MANVSAKNGVIALTDDDTYAKGSQNYKIMSVAIDNIREDASIGVALYTGNTVDPDNVVIEMEATGKSTFTFRINGCVSTGGGLLFTVDGGGGGVTCYVYVR